MKSAAHITTGSVQVLPEQDMNGNSGNASEDDQLSDGADGNRGWADVMGRLLSAPPPKKRYVILAKAKKTQPDQEDIEATKKTEKATGFDEEREDVKSKSARTPTESAARSKTIKRKEEVEKRQKLREWETMGRLKPDILDKERERTLCKIATRGVVQLFNAVRKHQLETNAKLKEAGGSIRKQEHALKEVTKQAFMERLKSSGQQSEDDEDELSRCSKRSRLEDQQASADGATWSVLRDDYMPEAALRDWDRHSGDSDAANSDEADGADSDD